MSERDHIVDMRQQYRNRRQRNAQIQQSHRSCGSRQKHIHHLA